MAGEPGLLVQRQAYLRGLASIIVMIKEPSIRLDQETNGTRCQPGRMLTKSRYGPVTLPQSRWWVAGLHVLLSAQLQEAVLHAGPNEVPREISEGGCRRPHQTMQEKHGSSLASQSTRKTR